MVLPEPITNLGCRSSMAIQTSFNTIKLCSVAVHGAGIGMQLRAVCDDNEFWAAQPPVQPQTARPRVRWTAPQGRIYKINFDVALFTTLDRAGIGVIIQDCKVLVVASLSHSIPLPSTVLETKTMAAVTALEFALELGLDSATLVGDSEILMNSLHTLVAN
nr:hypothetical protein CFP56_13721 [Quercus suber]